MKRILFTTSLLFLFSFGASAQSEPSNSVAAETVPATFKSDGCTLFPDGKYLDCCVEHDRSYYVGGNWKQRWRADKKLFKCVARKKGFEHKIIAPLMWIGVRVGGVSWLPTKFRWGFGRVKSCKNPRKNMSNLSDIGFPTRSEQDINDMISHVLELAETIRCPQGFYLKFSDASGAEIWVQGNFEQELIGFNPHFAGVSRRRVGLTEAIDRESSPLDGGFHAWANPRDEDVETSGDYPFVFDAPDFRLNQISLFPHLCEIQLTAFASNDFQIFADEKSYDASQEEELKYAAKSFVPVGLFAFDAENETVDLSVVRPIGKFTGEIKEYQLKTNELSGNEFYWFLIDTFGGEVDVVADVKLIPSEPKVGGIVSGQFWLSGRINEIAGKLPT